MFNIAGIIIRELKESKILKYDELLSSIVKETDKNAEELFIPASSFLFILNKVEYLPDIDSLRIINEA